jgi:hypothetical protein
VGINQKVVNEKYSIKRQINANKPVKRCKKKDSINYEVV